MLRVIVISVLLVGLTPGVARGTVWQWPVSGRIVGTFSFSPADPYAAGQRRGIVIAAVPGAPVRSACAGRVVFAGAVGRAGPTVSVQCGSLRATYQGLAGLRVAPVESVGAGEPIAHVGAAGMLHLGARAGPGAYVDPTTLLADPGPSLGPAPRAPRRRPAAPGARRHIAPPSLRALPRLGFAPRPSPSPAPAAPPLAWLGLALLIGATPFGALVRGRVRRRRAAREAVPSAA
ncbi:MAG: peptidoglycan DD-metalloendopeptidase family protein [Solirubrobacteraceae bacterium]